MWTKRGKACLILIFSTNTNCENMAYRSLRSEKYSARGVRKVTTGIILPCGAARSKTRAATVCGFEAVLRHVASILPTSPPQASSFVGMPAALPIFCSHFGLTFARDLRCPELARCAGLAELLASKLASTRRPRPVSATGVHRVVVRGLNPHTVWRTK